MTLSGNARPGGNEAQPGAIRGVVRLFRRTSGGWCRPNKGRRTLVSEVLNPPA
jgi:hypothetical protein